MGAPVRISRIVLLAGAAAGAAAAAGAVAAAAIAPAALAARTPGLTRYLVAPRELPGYMYSEAEVRNSLRAWLAGEPKSERVEDAQTYRAEGFRRAAFENFTAPKGLVGVSNIVVFGSAAGARQEEQTLLHPVGRTRLFRVGGIPGAHGFAQGDSKHASSADVTWVQGRCTLLIGEYRPRGRIARKPMIAAARRVYRRTRRTCP